MYRIEIYTSGQKNNWNTFVDNSKNATFLFYRDYMDYHANRFRDFSLMIYRKDKLFALLPANIENDILYSHQGLTYGGLLMSAKATVIDVLDTFNSINIFLKQNNIKNKVYEIKKVYNFVFDYKSYRRTERTKNNDGYRSSEKR